MRVVAPAKINLHLRVGRVRADGFHPLLTWMCTVELFDSLTLVRGPLTAVEARTTGETPAASTAAGDWRGEWFSLTTDHPSLPTDGRNLVTKVATALADTLGGSGEGPAGRRERVSAYLNKRIPAGAGLGGGSSDAAAMLSALAAMWKLNWSRSRLSQFAAQFGSDVPFFLHGPSSICTGRGEVVRPTPPPAKARYAVLVLSEIQMATPSVYAAYDQMKLGADLGDDATLASQPDGEQWSTLSADELMPRLVNDLERPAFELDLKLAELHGSLERVWKNKIVRMSGSGSTLFTLADDEASANDLADRANAELKADSNVGLKVTAKSVRLCPALNISPAGTSTEA